MHADEILSASTFVCDLPALIPSVATFRFYSYAPSRGVVERLLGNELRKVNDPHISLGSVDDWRNAIAQDSVITAFWDRGDNVLDELVRHDFDPRDRPTISVQTDKLSPSALSAITAQLPKGHVLALCSDCLTKDGETRHIPMMDFRCVRTSENEERILEAYRARGQARAALLWSGRSYHFYGLDLVTEAAWHKFLAYSLLLTPLTDTRYIAHRLLDGRCVLRLTASEIKPNEPQVVHITA